MVNKTTHFVTDPVELAQETAELHVVLIADPRGGGCGHGVKEQRITAVSFNHGNPMTALLMKPNSLTHRLVTRMVGDQRFDGYGAGAKLLICHSSHLQHDP